MFLELLSPPRCAACERPAADTFCETCAPTAVRSRNEGAAFVYEGAVAIAIGRLKYAGRFEHARALGTRMANEFRSRGRTVPTLVTAVPLHHARFRERGFNQAELLARAFARALGARYDNRLVRRTRATVPQASLGARERRANLVSAFHAKTRVDAATSVVLIDDVRATGRTLEACARALTECGFRTVETFVLAESGEEASISASDCAIAPRP